MEKVMKINKMFAEIVETSFGFSEDLLKVVLRFVTLLSRVKFETISLDLDTFFRKYESVVTKFSGRTITIPGVDPVNVRIFSSAEILAKNGIVIEDGYDEFIKTMFPHGFFLIENPTRETTINVYDTIKTFNESCACEEIGGMDNCVFNLSQVIYLMKNCSTLGPDGRNDIFTKYRYSIFFVKNQRGDVVSFAVEPLGSGWRLRTRSFNSGPGWMGDQLMYSRV